MSRERTAKEATIFSMLEGYPSLQGQISEGMIEAMVNAVEDCRVDAVAHACKRFSRGEVDGHNSAFAPSAGQLAEQARMFDQVLRKIDADKVDRPTLVSYPIGGEPPPPATPLGPIKLEVGGIMRDVSHLTYAEKEEVMRTGKMPEDPAPQIEGARFTPHVKRMSEQ